MKAPTPPGLEALARLTTPERIQDFLDRMPINHESGGETCSSPAHVLKRGTAHCLEGALLAAAALWLSGKPPLLMNLKTARGDDDHAVALFRKNGLWGAISKTNHAVLRYRDPVYRTPRELALSYFHEYYLADTGRKTFVAYSRPVRLTRFGRGWMTSTKDVWSLAYALRDAPHLPVAPRAALKSARRATAFERIVTNVAEWPQVTNRS